MIPRIDPRGPNACAWCAAPLDPLSPTETTDPVVVQLGRLCQACYEKQERRRDHGD